MILLKKENNNMVKEEVLRYLEKISGLSPISIKMYLISDLHLNSKEIIDFAIFFFHISGEKIPFGRDLSIQEVLEISKKNE